MTEVHLIAWKIPWTGSLADYSPGGCKRVWHDFMTETQTWHGMLLFSRYVVYDSLRPHGLQRVRSLSFTISQSLLKVMSTELVMLSSHLILCCPLLLLPSIFPSIGVFSNESVLCIRGPKYWSFSFSISPSNEYAGLISFRIDWFGLLAVQGALKGPFQTGHSWFTMWR